MGDQSAHRKISRRCERAKAPRGGFRGAANRWATDTARRRTYARFNWPSSAIVEPNSLTFARRRCTWVSTSSATLAEIFVRALSSLGGLYPGHTQRWPLAPSRSLNSSLRVTRPSREHLRSSPKSPGVPLGRRPAVRGLHRLRRRSTRTSVINTPPRLPFFFAAQVTHRRSHTRVDVIEGERERLINHSEPPAGLSRAADASGVSPVVALSTVRIGSTAGSGTFRAGVVWVGLCVGSERVCICVIGTCGASAPLATPVI